jgi:serine/threonine protein kinase
MAVLELPTQASTIDSGNVTESTDMTENTRDEMRLMVTDRYQVIRPLGQGGMGIVYEAWDRLLRRRVALKLIRPDTAQEAAAAARLVREARVMAALEHDHVVSAYDVGTWEERVFIAMQMIEGMTLRHWAQAAPRTDSEKLRVLIGAGRGLAAAHARQIVHRDFKPDNVLVDVRGIARVTDFGIARQLDRTEPELVPGVDPLGDTQLTRSGAMLGTPAYMAPEQALGGVITARVDQYSFCVTAWELFAGHRPFAGASVSEVISNKIAGEMVPTPTDKWPAGLVQVLRQGLSVEPSGRFASLNALLAELERIEAAKPARSGGRLLRVAALIGGTAAAGALSYVLIASGPASANTQAAAAPSAAATGIQVTAIELPAAPVVTPITNAAPTTDTAPAAESTPREPSRTSRPATRKSRSSSSSSSPKASVAAAEPARAAEPRASASSDASAKVSSELEKPAAAAPVAAPAAPDADLARELLDRELSSVDAARLQRNLLSADIPGYAAARDHAIAAAARGDSGAASEQVAVMREKIAAVRIDSRFVEAKFALLNERASKVHLDDAQSRTLQSRLTSAQHAWGADQFEVANRHLTALGKLLGIR